MLYSTKSPLNKLYSITNDYEIFKHYLGKDFQVNGRINSPLRKDSNPSFSLHFNKNKELRFKDFKTGEGGSAIEFVKIKYNCSANEALYYIDRDLGLGIFSSKDLKNPSNSLQTYFYKEKAKYKITIEPRKWNSEDINYWKSFGISFNTLVYFKVVPINSFFIGINFNMYRNQVIQPAYAYKLGSRIKIYSPLADKLNKFKGNANENTIQGWSQVNKKHKNLIITSSLKEVMLLHELGYTAIAPNSESSVINSEFIKLFKKYFNIIIMYDFDEAGQTLSEKHSKLYNCNYVKYNNLKDKDLTDFYKSQGKQNTINLINNILKQHLI